MKLSLFIFLLSLSAYATGPCGMTGPIEDRIKECNLINGDFALVSRTEKGLEIYKDLKTGLLWGDRIMSDFNQYGSQKACEQELTEAQLLSEVNWRLPTVHEFEVAAARGMKSILPRMFHAFWTSTPAKIRTRFRRRSVITARAFLWLGDEEKTDIGDLKDGASVRCVAKAK